MGVYSNAAKNAMLNAVTVNQMSLHTGDPGASGTANEVTGGTTPYARQTCVFGAAAAGVRTLTTQVDFTGPSGGAATWIGLWNTSGSVFQGADQLAGDATFNASGEFHVTTATTMTVTDT